MKRLHILTFICVIIMMCAVSIPSFAENPSVYDGAGFLTEAQVIELEARLGQIRTSYAMDVSIVTESVMSGSSAMNTADDIFDKNGYGYGENKDGILLYVSQNPRKYHFSTHSRGMLVFNDTALVTLENSIIPYLKTDNYYEAFVAYADTAEKLLLKAENSPTTGGTTRLPIKTQKPVSRIIIAVCLAVLAPLLVAFLLTYGKIKKMNTVNKQDYASEYMKPGSMNITKSSDVFLYSTVTKTPKPESKSSGHISSSGQTHGGRGGSY